MWIDKRKRWHFSPLCQSIYVLNGEYIVILLLIKWFAWPKNLQKVFYSSHKSNVISKLKTKQCIYNGRIDVIPPDFARVFTHFGRFHIFFFFTIKVFLLHNIFWLWINKIQYIITFSCLELFHFSTLGFALDPKYCIISFYVINRILNWQLTFNFDTYTENSVIHKLIIY